MSNRIIDVKNLSVVLKQKKGSKIILHGSTFYVNEGECLGILGESGSGKSITMQAVMGLLDRQFLVDGEVLFDGKNLLHESGEARRKLRGSKIAMIMQNPMTAFDPLIRIDEQIIETFAEHTDFSVEKIRKNAIEVFQTLQIKDPEESIKKYPHQLSGGMLQRIMIGIALMLQPKLIIADEPTTALDSLTQYEVLKAFRQIKQSGTSMVFITHDLGVAKYISDRIVVMNQGRIVDRGSFEDILEHATDPYTRLLIEKKSAVMNRYKNVLQEGVGVLADR